MQMSERFLLRDYIYMVAGCIGDELANLVGCHRAAGWSDEWLRWILERMLEVRRIHVDLECGESPHLLLLKNESRYRSAREIVVESAIAHCRPVSDRRAFEPSRWTGSSNELLH